jgi:hypothetical protein
VRQAKSHQRTWHTSRYQQRSRPTSFPLRLSPALPNQRQCINGMTRASHRQNYVIPPRRNGRSRWSNSLRDRTQLRPVDQQSQPGLLRRKTLARSPNSQFRLRLGDETYAPHQSARLYAAAITLDREPLALPSTRKSSEDSSAGMRSETATRRRSAEATAIEDTTEERSRRSSGV